MAGNRPKSYTYHTSLEWRDGRAGQMASGDKLAFRVASPPEFRGEAGVWSPEDLFVASANACTMTTFLAFAERQALEVLSYTSDAEGLLELVERGFRFTRITLRPVIQVDAAQVESARQVMHEAHSKCLISRSMACEVVVETTVTAG